MKVLIADTETNGLYDEVTKIHCLVLRDPELKKSYRFTAGGALGCAPLEDGFQMLSEADVIVGHNLIKFDVPVIQKLYPRWTTSAAVRDTLVLTRLIWTDLWDGDRARVTKGTLPANLMGKHSLEAWGHRMGVHKGNFKGPWDTLTQEMLDYCEQDILVTEALWNLCLSRKYSEESIELEHAVAEIIGRQERHGVLFDLEAAGTLYGKLVQRMSEVEAELKAIFGSWEVRTPFTPKANNKKRGYVKGVTTEKVEVITFNPASRDHIAERLTTLFGWKPTSFTDGGKPAIDETILSGLDCPPAKLLSEYLLLGKRIGQLAEGKQALMKSVAADGRIHGSVNTNGAVTGRMTHSHPNISQVTKCGSSYGAEFRALFIAPPRKKLVGIDASGLELRNLGHFLAKWDGGKYAVAVVEGRSTDGTDIHSVNCRALGIDPIAIYVISGKQQKGRDCAKTFIYAYLYGAGDEKIGKIVGKGNAEGKKLKAQFLAKTNGLKALKDAIAETVRLRGYLKGIDGRRLKVRSAHAALNTLLQSAGGVVMKKALVILDTDLRVSGYIHGRDYSFVINSHDEFQIETEEGIADEIGKRGVQAIKAAGAHFKYRCPLDGEYKVGNNWRETH